MERCELCQKHRSQLKEPLLPTPLPDRPWQKVGMDLFEWSKRDYLLIIDYFSRYIEIAELKSTLAEVTIRAIKEVFARHGTAELVISDNGPQFSSSVFREFAKENNFIHITSSPRYPQAHGEAERDVRTIKDWWKKDSDHSRALRAYRSQVHPIGARVLTSTAADGKKPAFISTPNPRPSWILSGQTCRPFA